MKLWLAGCGQLQRSCAMLAWFCSEQYGQGRWGDSFARQPFTRHSQHDAIFAAAQQLFTKGAAPAGAGRYHLITCVADIYPVVAHPNSPQCKL
jgi:hypothetical protein